MRAARDQVGGEAVARAAQTGEEVAVKGGRRRGPATASARVPSGENRKPRTVRRTSQLSSASGCTSIPTSGACSASTSR
ncbi:hypothetical protein SVIOM342S_10278 [Streptomyces violaceorubidus]